MTDFLLWTSESRTSNSKLVKFLLFDAFLINEHFLAYAAASVALYDIFVAIIMLIYKSPALKADHLHSYLKFQAYEPNIHKKVREF